MLSLLIRWVLFAGALLLTAWIVPGISFAGFMSALLAALVMGLVNVFIRPILLVLSLPLNLLTLGLFTFIVNALMLLLVAKLVAGFMITGFLAALLGSIVLSVLSLFINRFDF
ncbi:MAG: phage holin family protein [Candidatus Gastranaerophilaceae bacterium]